MLTRGPRIPFLALLPGDIDMVLLHGSCYRHWPHEARVVKVCGSCKDNVGWGKVNAHGLAAVSALLVGHHFDGATLQYTTVCADDYPWTGIRGPGCAASDRPAVYCSIRWYRRDVVGGRQISSVVKMWSSIDRARRGDIHSTRYVLIASESKLFELVQY